MLFYGGVIGNGPGVGQKFAAAVAEIAGTGFCDGFVFIVGSAHLCLPDDNLRLKLGTTGGVRVRVGRNYEGGSRKLSEMNYKKYNINTNYHKIDGLSGVQNGKQKK